MCKFTYIFNLNLCCGSHIIFQVYHISLYKQINQGSFFVNSDHSKCSSVCTGTSPMVFLQTLCLRHLKLSAEYSLLTLVWCKVQGIAALIFVWLMPFLILAILKAVSVVSPLHWLVFKQNSIKIGITVAERRPQIHFSVWLLCRVADEPRQLRLFRTLEVVEHLLNSFFF